MSWQPWHIWTLSAPAAGSPVGAPWARTEPAASHAAASVGVINNFRFVMRFRAWIFSPSRSAADPEKDRRILGFLISRGQCAARSPLFLEELELVLHALPFVGVGRSRLALDNVLPHLGKLGIDPGEVLLVVGDIVLREDRLHGTFGDAQRAVDALVRIDHEEVRPFAEAVDRAYVDAVGVLALDAAFGDDVGHVRDPGKRVDFSKAAPQLAASACTSAGVGLPYFCTRRPVRGAVRSGAPASRSPRGIP